MTSLKDFWPEATFSAAIQVPFKWGNEGIEPARRADEIFERFGSA
jgi:hypothetical protein